MSDFFLLLELISLVGRVRHAKADELQVLHSRDGAHLTAVFVSVFWAVDDEEGIGTADFLPWLRV